MAGGVPEVGAVGRYRFRLAGALASVAVLAVATYGGVLRYGFTGSDTLSLIATARLRSAGDLARILTEPLMAGTSFVAHGLFYRPVSTLSFSLDGALWGLNPFGYHLTDLLLHVAVTVLVLLAVRRLREGRLGAAWLAAALFTTHPILVESVPAISRRQDALAALFLLLALLLHLRWLAGRRGRWLAAALGAYLLALGAKEVAVVFPLLVLAHGTLFPADGARALLRRGLRRAAPYLAATALALAWRVALLGRVGGIIDESFGAWQDLQAGVAACWTYLVDLVFPVALIRLSPGRLAPAMAPAAGVAAGGLLLAIALGWRRVRRRWFQDGSPVWRAASVAAAAAGLLALAGLGAAPLTAPARPASRSWALGWSALLLLLLASLLALAAIRGRERLRRWVAESERGRWEAFFALWLPPFLLMFTFTHGLAHRSMYISVIPFSALLALALTDGWSAWRGRRLAAAPAVAGSTGVAGSALRGGRWWAALRLAVPALLGLYLLVYSPLLRTYPEWGEAGRFSDVFFRQLERALGGLPGGATLHVHGLPSRFEPGVRRRPHVRSASFPTDYTIESWLDLRRPDHRLRVTVDRLTSLPGFHGRVEVVTRVESVREVHVDVRVDGRGG